MEENNKNIERFVRMNGAGNKFLVFESFQKSLIGVGKGILKHRMRISSDVLR